MTLWLNNWRNLQLALENEVAKYITPPHSFCDSLKSFQLQSQFNSSSNFKIKNSKVFLLVGLKWHCQTLSQIFTRYNSHVYIWAFLLCFCKKLFTCKLSVFARFRPWKSCGIQNLRIHVSRWHEPDFSFGFPQFQLKMWIQNFVLPKNLSKTT